MPSTYAHYRMGQDVLLRLPEDIRSKISRETDLFNMGLQGPDLLFYYRPLELNRINRTGYAMHRRAGREFIIHAAKTVRSRYFSDGYFAYVCGFICHFALDRQCHEYIMGKISKSHASHAGIELEFDRSLLIHDGFDPAVRELIGHIRPDFRSARIVSAFFPGIKAGHILKAMRSLKFYHKLLLAPTRAGRSIVNALLEMTGNYRYMSGSVMTPLKKTRCKGTSKALAEKYSAAVTDAATLICEFRECACGRKEWSRLYDYTFGAKLPDE